MENNITNEQLPAFAAGAESWGQNGLTKLEYFVAHSPYEPTNSEIDAFAQRERAANPHNESNKPELHSWDEIKMMLIIKRAKYLLNQLEK